MLAMKKIEVLISKILILGTLISAILVTLGGSLYLLQHGSENISVELLQANTYQLSVVDMIRFACSFSPIGLIEIGLITLVATQILRVGLLFGFYLFIRDYWFTLISSFILFTLIYSFIWRH